MAPQGRLVLVMVAAVLFVCVGTAVAAAPGVLYGAPTNVTQSGAVLQGSINPSDRPTTYYFDYGSSTGYGATTAQATLPKSKAWQAVSAVITGLSAGSTYHYRIVAWNGGGTKDKTVGSDHTFTTASPPDPPSSPGDTTPDVSAVGDTLPDQGGEASPAGGLRPTLGSSVVVHPVAGRVLIRRPGSGRFARMATDTEIPFESEIDASHARSRSPLLCPPGAPRPAGSAADASSCAMVAGATSTSISAAAPARGRAGTRDSGRRLPLPRGGGTATIFGGMTMAGGSAPTAATVRRPCAERAGLWRTAATARSPS